MTFWECMKSDKTECAVGIAFCIAAYEEQSTNIYFEKNSLKEFILDITDDILEWLDNEVEGVE